MDATDVSAAAAQCERFLAGVVDRDWEARIPDMEWSVARAVAHAANVLLWYAFDLSAGDAEVDTLEVRVKPDRAPAQLIATLVAAARVVAGAIAASPPGRRGFHPLGQADPSGFAAMSCDELLIHTDDAGRGLGLTIVPDPTLCGRVLARLFPDAPVPADIAPWDGLRWANGRIALPGLPRRQGWRWDPTPRGEWRVASGEWRVASGAQQERPSMSRAGRDVSFCWVYRGSRGCGHGTGAPAGA